MKQALALLLALMTAVLFASCGTAEPADAEDRSTTTTLADRTDSAAPTTSIDERESGASADSTTQDETSTAPAQGSTAPEGSTAATGTTPAAQSSKALSQAELLAVYNKALAASALQRREYKRSLAAGGLWRSSEPEAVLNLAEEDGVVALLKQSNSQAAPSDLSPLESSWVQHITAQESGGSTVLTIQLKSLRKSGLNSTSEAGYTGIVPLDEFKTLIPDIGKSMYNVSAVSVSSNTTGLSGGTITAVLSGGKLASVSYKAQQTFDADLKILLVIGAGLTITFALSAEYA